MRTPWRSVQSMRPFATRWPSAQIQTGSIILAALIEGAALFGLVIAGFIK